MKKWFKRFGKIFFWWVFLNWIPYNISEEAVKFSRKLACDRGAEEFKDYKLNYKWVWLKTIENAREIRRNITTK